MLSNKTLIHKIFNVKSKSLGINLAVKYYGKSHVEFEYMITYYKKKEKKIKF